MNSANVAEIIKNIGDIGLTGKYNSGSLTPMGLNGPTTNPFLGRGEPGSENLAPVMRGGVRRMKSVRHSHKKRRRSHKRKRSVKCGK
jgi:hypothetical protein